MTGANTNIYLVCTVLCISILLGFFLHRASAADIIATITTGIFAPQEPVNLAVTVGDNSVSLSWSPPFSNGGSNITDYVLEYKLSSGGVWSIFADGVSTDTYGVVSGLSNDNAYDFRVSAVNTIGSGPSSAHISATPGAPAQVIVNSFGSVIIPNISTNIRITNEGAAAYEYQYTWCITNADTNLCGGGNDIFNSSAAKLIQPGENWDTALPSTVSSVGTYWFHIAVTFGSDASYASQSFTAVEAPRSGGGGSSSKAKKPVAKCIGADLNHDTKVSLIDFSILMVFFNTPSPYLNPCADINLDGTVSVVDFSIMLTQWGKIPVQFKL